MKIKDIYQIKIKTRGNISGDEEVAQTIAVDDNGDSYLLGGWNSREFSWKKIELNK